MADIRCHALIYLPGESIRRIIALLCTEGGPANDGNQFLRFRLMYSRHSFAKLHSKIRLMPGKIL